MRLRETMIQLLEYGGRKEQRILQEAGGSRA
jgi:hypothetical protein